MPDTKVLIVEDSASLALGYAAQLEDAGHEVSQEQGGENGPGSFVVIDPDGNPILIDQHR